MADNRMWRNFVGTDDYDDVDNDPFGTMEVSMEDLETFGTDLSENRNIKRVVEKICITPEKDVTGSDTSDVSVRPAVKTSDQRLNASVDHRDKNMSVAREVIEKSVQVLVKFSDSFFHFHLLLILF
jgi:hypothetical protein